MQTFRTRALTAVVFAVVMLAGLFWNEWSFIILFVIIHTGCWWEYFKLAEKIHATKIDDLVKCFYIFIGSVLIYYVAVPNVSLDFLVGVGEYQVSSKYLFLGFLFLLLLIFLTQNKQLMSILGFLYISLPIVSLISLRLTEDVLGDPFLMIEYGKIIPCTIIFSIWINDTMAYIVGSLIGKTPFSKISPKKTWEGTAGGAILCVALIALIAYFTQLLPVQDAIAISAICGIFGTAGDLIESKLKRMADVKDSGTFMPGHGGFLDRFDSLLVAAPFVWLYVKLSGL